MARGTRRARVKAFAKLNLCLEVLGRRPDGFHDLRTVFQTISLADSLEIDFTPGRRTEVVLDSTVDIPNNLVVRAARAVLDATNASGVATFRLVKRIPMGGGLGGGSTDAAAVLLGLPALTGKSLGWEKLLELGSTLGSDVPFFLMGGTALGLGRGTELYPLADASARHVLLVAPGIHVSTPEAFRSLNRPLLSNSAPVRPNVAQRMAMELAEKGDWRESAMNDFESAVFAKHPELKRIKAKLRRLGARPAMMTGSGSAIFGVFSSAEALAAARAALKGEVEAVPLSFVSRKRYRELWDRSLSM